MRVLHLGKRCPPFNAGIENFTLDLLSSLSTRGVEVDLVCFGQKNDVACYDKKFNYYSCKTNFVVNSMPVSTNYFAQVLRLMENYDIIHVHCPNPLAEIIACMSQKKVVAHWHNDIVRQKLSYVLYKPFQQAFLRKVERIIVTSPQYLETSLQLKSYRNKAVVIPLGLDPRRLQMECDDESEAQRLLSQAMGRKIVLSVGRLVEYKGFVYLVRAAQFLNDDVVVMIAGDGPEMPVLRKEVEKLGLENKVILLGKVKCLNVLMRNSSLFCLPSINRTEGFGVVLMEALYFGKPLITTNVVGSGMNYVNKNGETGLIVPPRDPQALAEAIDKILSNVELYKRFSNNALQRFAEFNIDSTAERTIELYQEVLT